AEIALLGAGFATVNAVGLAWLWYTGAWDAYKEQLWHWGRLYAASPFVESPLRNGLLRTLNWAGFHAAAILAALSPVTGHRLSWPVRPRPGNDRPQRAIACPTLAWLALSLVGVAAGLRFFPRYYFLLLPPLILLGARGMRPWIALLLLIPAARFAPSYVA